MSILTADYRVFADKEFPGNWTLASAAANVELSFYLPELPYTASVREICAAMRAAVAPSGLPANTYILIDAAEYQALHDVPGQTLFSV